ncbi:hypothetical protein EDB92DRAFT_1818100 [Lactarius akahatsu]|uniref:DUF6535 domain-containing protein n=1 Tax=Lactarius akahatsu TaxID=416441 RepID=A0AAD4QB82_9AGAM|nr:hypothetical protein EDB92DRAFT_1818100 [Lactarius akahatsu]
MAPRDSGDSDVVYEKTRYTPQPEHTTEARGGVTSKFPSELWLKYLDEIGEQDKAMVERYQEEADSTLVFAGLFTAVIMVSIVESYKWLSPDPGDETVRLLTQLVNISSGIPLENSSAGIGQPFKPTTSAIMVNATWFCSVVLCLACAVFATLIQQQTRQYLVLTQRPGAPYERASLRMFLFNGLGKFYVDTVLQLLSMSLHTSILLYCVGLVIYIFTIGEGIGFLTLGPVTLGPLSLGYLAIFYLSTFYFIYGIATYLPFFYFDCPYGTPFTALAWCLHHILLSGVFSIIRCIPGLRLEKRINEHIQKFRDGLQRTVELCGIQAQQSVDANALEWTLQVRAPVEKDKTESIAASVPEFFDDYALSEFYRPNPISFRRLKTYILGFSTRLFTGKSDTVKRKNPERLRVSLECLWCWVRVYNQNSVPLPPHFSPPDTHHLKVWAEQDPTASIIGRCFCALVAKKLASDVNSSRDSGVDFHDSELDSKLRSLSTILGKTREDVDTYLRQPGAISLVSIIFITPTMENALGTKNVPSDVLDIFRTTARILAEDISTSPDAGPPQNLVDRFNETYSNAQEYPALARLADQLKPIKEKLDARRARDGHFGTA